jgi:hypothetical protein
LGTDRETLARAAAAPSRPPGKETSMIREGKTFDVDDDARRRMALVRARIFQHGIVS